MLVWAVVSGGLVAGAVAGALLAKGIGGPAAAAFAPYSPGHAALLASYHQTRRFAIEPQITGAAIHGFSPPREPGELLPALAFSGEAFSSRMQAEALVERELTERPRPEARAAAGVRQLLNGTPERAIVSLETALLEQPEDPRILNDLAAAHLVKARDSGDPEDLIRGLMAAERALEIEPSMPEASFNYAFALDSLFLRSAARREWTRHLRLEGSAERARQVRHRIAELGRSPVDGAERVRSALREAARKGERDELIALATRLPTEARELAEDELLTSWAHAVLAGDEAGAREALETCGALATALRETTGETLLSDELAAIRDTALRGSVAITDMAGAQLLYARARILYLEGRETQAQALFEKARGRFATMASPLADWSAFYTAVAEYRRSNLEAAMSRLDDLLQSEGISAYPSLRGRTHWMRGLVLLSRGDPAAALDSYRGALSAFEKAGLSSDAARVYLLLAEAYGYLGDTEATLRHLYAALEHFDLHGDTRRYDLPLTEMADALESEYPRVAVRYHDQVVTVASVRKDAEGLVHALLRRGALHERLGNLRAAETDLAAAQALLAGVRDPAIRSRLSRDLAMARAPLVLKQDPVEAVGLLNQVLAAEEDEGRAFEKPQLLLIRARAHLATRDVEGAETDLRLAFAEHERQGREISSLRHRLSFLGQLGTVTEDMIRLQLEKGEIGAALWYSDRAKAHLLPSYDLPPGDSYLLDADLSPKALAHLPAGLAVLSYGVLAQRLVVWMIDREGVRAREVPVGQPELHELVATMKAEVAGEAGADSTVASERLFEVLLAPFAPEVARMEALVFVPDGPLHDVPFSALVDAVSGRFLIEDFTVVVSPTASGYLAWLSSRTRPLDPIVGPALVVASPEVPPTISRVAPVLAAAEAEGRIVVEKLRGSRLLTGTAATRDAFLGEVGDYPVLHLATHAFANRRHPLLSYFVLASSHPEEPGSSLYAGEIAGLGLRHAQLAFLSACATMSRDFGNVTLATAFLAAGVPVVVGALWPIDDGAALAISSEFYELLSRGAAPAAALRAAQLKVHRDRPSGRRNWAAFRAVGNTY